MTKSGYHKGEGFNKERTTWDAILEKRPPKILWKKNRHGVMEAVLIEDPHTETASEVRAERLRAQEQADRECALDLMQQEADEVAERLRKHRADNSPLMAAARTEL